MSDDNKTPEEVQKLLKYCLDYYHNEDLATRERQMRLWRRMKLYWNGFRQVYWDEVAHDWRVWNTEYNADVNDDSDAAYYDKPVNVFRAYLESIIAALSVIIPPLKCFPDDAENPLDLQTAKAGDQICELIKKHNDASLLWLQALYVYCTEGTVYCYSYPKTSKEYGSYSINREEEQEQLGYVCPNCNANLADETFDSQLENEFMPDDEDASLQYLLQEEDLPICPQCAMMLDPNLQKTTFTVTRIVGTDEKPKTRQCLEVYGGLYVKIANYAKKPCDTPYLEFSYETHYANVLEIYPHLWDKFGKNKIASGGQWDPYESNARLNLQYSGEFPQGNVTVRNLWIRPQGFNILKKEEKEDMLKRYPNGCKTVFVNDIFADACNEALDDCWTMTKNPLSDYITHDPLGLLLTSIQDITNDLVALTLQTIEQGIPQTFADPVVLNFNQYKQTRVAPGSIFPAKPKSGKTVADGFYEVKTATLSAEVMPFSQNIQEFGQLVSGALPSLFGGGPTEGSKTAAEYSMSRAQGMQRLQTTWKMLIVWWKEIFSKVVPMYIKDVADDEKSVQRDKYGNFINVFIRKAELEGRIGSIELEGSEQLPVSWAQQKDVIMQLFAGGVPQILEALSSPENIGFVKEAIGLNQFILPGEDDRVKQLEEIQLLVNSAPIQIPNMDMMTGQMMPMTVPSIDIDPSLDNHQIEAQVCRHWLISSAGRLCKLENPPGYENVLLHMQMHMQEVAKAMMAQQAQLEAQNSDATGGNEPKKAPAVAKQGVNNAARDTGTE